MAQPTDATALQSRGSSLPSETYVPQVMPRVLGTFDMTTLYIVVIFFIVNAVTAASGDDAAFTYLLLGAIAFYIPCVIAATQLGHMFPHEGSLYNWTHKAMGGYWSFFCGFCGWLPGILVMAAGADIVVTLIQGLNSNWLTQPWQQGVAITIILLFSTVLSLQRTHVVQLVVNAVVVLIGVAVLLIGLSAVVWLTTGHASATNFVAWSHWKLNWSMTSGNLNLFGLITLAYLGTEVPLTMGSEMRERKIVPRHLLWGTVLVLIGYFIATASLLIVQGSAVGSIGSISLVKNVDMTLGTTLGSVVAICMMSFFIIVPVVYNTAFSRLLFVGAIDRRLPASMGRLNRNRVPARAILLQTVFALIYTVVAFIIVPYLFSLSQPANLAAEVYNVSQAGTTLIWAIATAFLFINILLLYRQDPKGFRAQCIVPFPLLMISVVVGPAACAVAIVDSLLFPWIPQISSSQWWYIVGGLTIACLVIASIGSILATGEASWENLRQGESVVID